MLILYKNDRNVRFVLFTKTSSVAGSNPTGSKFLAQINLPFTTKQYNIDIIANFV